MNHSVPVISGGGAGIGVVPRLRCLRNKVIELMKLHRRGQLHNNIVTEKNKTKTGKVKIDMTITPLPINDQLNESLTRSSADVEALGQAFLNTWNILMENSLVSSYPKGFQALCAWMANTSEAFQKFRRPRLAHVLGYLDFYIDSPEKAPELDLILQDQLPRCTYYFKQLKPYLVDRCPLSSGGSCTTYLIDYKDKKLVCKLGEPGNRRLLQDFWHEALLLDQLQGAGGSPKLYANCSDRPCLFLSCVNGKTLYKVYKNLTALGLVEVFLALAQSLQQVHEAGILHNDIKSDNVLVTVPEDGLGKVEAALIDFGLGTNTLVDDVVFPQTTNAASYIKYPWYAPELYYNKGASFASDIFSLGMLFEQCVGQQIKSGKVRALPEGLEELVADMVEYEQEDRPLITEIIPRLDTMRQSLSHLNRTIDIDELEYVDDSSDESYEDLDELREDQSDEDDVLDESDCSLDLDDTDYPSSDDDSDFELDDYFELLYYELGLDEGDDWDWMPDEGDVLDKNSDESDEDDQSDEDDMFD